MYASTALNEHSASSTRSPDFMRLSLRVARLRVHMRVRLRRVHKAQWEKTVIACTITYARFTIMDAYNWFN